MSTYTHKNLGDLEDFAAKNGMGDGFSARFGREPLDCEQAGFGLQALDPGKRAPIAHRHNEAEEVYVVIAGSGRMLLDDEVRPIALHDAIRVSPAVVRSFEAGDEGLQVLVFGAHRPNDGEILTAEWPAE